MSTQTATRFIITSITKLNKNDNPEILVTFESYKNKHRKRMTLSDMLNVVDILPHNEEEIRFMPVNTPFPCKFFI